MQTRFAVLFLLCLSMAACATADTADDAVAPPQAVTLPGVTGNLRHYEQFPSRHVAARNIDVWLPPGYDADSRMRYPVVYMQDGQNLDGLVVVSPFLHTVADVLR